MKQKVFLAAVFTMLFTCICYGADEVSITIDGNTVETDAPAQIVDGRTLVPLRAIFEALGAEVNWNGAEKMITARKADIEINMKIDEKSYMINSEEMGLDVAPMIIDGRTMVPIRAVSESFGCDVKWDSEKREVSITTPVISVTETTTESITETVTELVTEEAKLIGFNSGFKVGKDITAGEYEFRITEGRKFAYINLTGDGINSKDGIFLINSSSIINLGKGAHIYIVNCDIYKNGKLFAKCTDEYKSDIDMDIANVNIKLKNRISMDINSAVERYKGSNKSSDIEKMKKDWDKIAVSPEDNKYIELIYNGFCTFNNYLVLNVIINGRDMEKIKEEYYSSYYMTSSAADLAAISKKQGNIKMIAGYMAQDLSALTTMESFEELDRSVNNMKQYDITLYTSEEMLLIYRAINVGYVIVQ